MGRRTLVAANWKMHKTASEAVSFVATLQRDLDVSTGAPEVVIFPSHPLLAGVARAIAGTSIALGGQDLHPEPWGAHTGDTSGHQLLDCGCAWVLVGHSERRRDHHEDDGLVGRKLQAALEVGLLPIVCLGETLQQREAGETESVLERQVRALAAGLAALGSTLVIAYEPVWAIGTGRTATPEIAQQAHQSIRRRLREELGDVAQEARLLYGGSVKPENCRDLLDQPDVDGFLIGGASLDPASFLDIIRRCAR